MSKSLYCFLKYLSSLGVIGKHIKAGARRCQKDDILFMGGLVSLGYGIGQVVGQGERDFTVK
jgi:hypothetical protein